VTGRRPHVFLPGTGRPLLLLHGTGGDEHDLLPLRELLTPGAPVLSPRGTVLENGMPRHFRRLREGVFDEDDLRERVDELAGFLGEAEAEHGIEPGSWVAVGFSNGANMASATLLLRPETLAGAALFAAMVPFADPPAVDLGHRPVAVANGRHDPMATPQQTELLVAQLRDRGATVELFPHDGGHALPPSVLPGVRAFLEKEVPA
jgi:phospholipase/carboxylesterase